jgi:hypothetical protein
MADTLGGYCFFDNSFGKMLSEPRFVYNGDATQHTMMNPKVRVLDIASKTGLYSLYVAYSLYKLRSSQSQGLFDTLTDDEAQQLWDDIVSNNIFAVCRTRMADRVTRRTLMGYRDNSNINICHMADMNSQVILYKRKFIRTVTDPHNFSSKWKKQWFWVYWLNASATRRHSPRTHARKLPPQRTIQRKLNSQQARRKLLRQHARHQAD